MLQLMKSFIKEEEGVTAIEYGLIAALVAIVIITVLTTSGTNLNTLWTRICSALAGAVTTGTTC